jgi:hypothetical protein
MRIAFHIALILSILYTPWWAFAVILISACFLIDRFYESIIYGVIVDVLYGTPVGWHGFAYMGTLFAAATFIIASAIRNRLAW